MSKIKWNDDRIRHTLTAVLLISRSRLARGVAHDLVAQALLEYRNNYQAYKDEHWDKARAAFSDPSDLGPLKNPAQIACYQNLLKQVEAMKARFKKNQIQFNSVVELDKYLTTYLKAPE